MTPTRWFQHTFRPARWQPQRQAVALGILAVTLVMIIGALYLAHSASTSTLGRQLEALIRDRDALEQTNAQLRAEIGGFVSVPRLLQRARELGFVEATADTQRWLVIAGYNPNREQTEAPLEVEAEPLPEYDETFDGFLEQAWYWLTSQFESFLQQETP